MKLVPSTAIPPFALTMLLNVLLAPVQVLALPNSVFRDSPMDFSVANVVALPPATATDPVPTAFITALLPNLNPLWLTVPLTIPLA